MICKFAALIWSTGRSTVSRHLNNQPEFNRKGRGPHSPTPSEHREGPFPKKNKDSHSIGGSLERVLEMTSGRVSISLCGRLGLVGGCSQSRELFLFFRNIEVFQHKKEGCVGNGSFPLAPLLRQAK